MGVQLLSVVAPGPCCASITLAVWGVRVRSGVVPLQVGLVEGICARFGDSRMAGRCANCRLVRGFLMAGVRGLLAPVLLTDGESVTERTEGLAWS